ncbi:hypothetical protein RYX36_023689 [Vicia faba]
MLTIHRPLHFSFLLTFFFLFFHSHFTSGKQHDANAVTFSRYDALATEPEPELVPYGNSPLPLAAERTRRKDPLDGFNVYTNGWNISDHHYWASVAYTAVPVFSIATIWFIGFGFCLLLLIVCYFCRKNEPYGYYPTCYTLSLILLILFTITTMIGCAVLYFGQGSFHHSIPPVPYSNAYPPNQFPFISLTTPLLLCFNRKIAKHQSLQRSRLDNRRDLTQATAEPPSMQPTPTNPTPAYFSATDGTTTDNNGVKASLDGSATGKRRLPGIRGETNNKSLEAMVINARKESLQWGAAAGIQGWSKIYVCLLSMALIQN